MKILLGAIALLTIAEASFPAFNSWDSNYNRPNYEWYKPGRGPPWAYPSQNVQPTQTTTNIEWVCQNPKTNDMMIIASDQSSQWNGYTWPQGRPWENGVAPGSQRNNPQEPSWVHGSTFINPGKTTASVGGIDGIQSLPSTPSPFLTVPKNNENNDNNNQPRSTPRYHGGEGQIDIRMGE